MQADLGNRLELGLRHYRELNGSFLPPPHLCNAHWPSLCPNPCDDNDDGNADKQVIRHSVYASTGKSIL